MRSTSGCAQGLFLPLHSRITPGRLRGLYGSWVSFVHGKPPACNLYTGPIIRFVKICLSELPLETRDWVPPCLTECLAGKRRLKLEPGPHFPCSY